jgi:hypothetical protein
MNRLSPLVLSSLLLLGTGCPHDWMKGGTNDRAMGKDRRESLSDDDECPEGMTWQEDCSDRLADGSCPLRCK